MFQHPKCGDFVGFYGGFMVIYGDLAVFMGCQRFNQDCYLLETQHGHGQFVDDLHTKHSYFPWQTLIDYKVNHFWRVLKR